MAEGLVTPASGLDGNNVYRWRCKLATIDRTATAAISAAKVTDARPKNKVWHSGNDGDGSALDADTLDGKHYTDLLPVVVTGSIIASANSYAVGETLSTGKATLPGGVILQWGVTPNIPAYTLSEPVTFDPPFPSQCFFVTASPYYDTSGDMVSTHSVTKTGFKCANRGNGPGDGLTICRYFAIGY